VEVLKKRKKVGMVKIKKVGMVKIKKERKAKNARCMTCTPNTHKELRASYLSVDTKKMILSYNTGG